MSLNNAIVEKFLSSEEVAMDIQTFKFSTWYQINIEFINSTVKVFMSEE